MHVTRIDLPPDGRWAKADVDSLTAALVPVKGIYHTLTQIRNAMTTVRADAVVHAAGLPAGFVAELDKISAALTALGV